MWLVIRNNYCCDSGENLDGFLDGLGGGALGGSEGTGGDVGENTTLCRFGVDLGDPGILNHFTVCESERNPEKLLYALCHLLDTGIYRCFFRSIRRMVMEGFSGWCKKKRSYQWNQDDHLLLYLGSYIVRGSATGNCISW